MIILNSWIAEMSYISSFFKFNKKTLLCLKLDANEITYGWKTDIQIVILKIVNYLHICWKKNKIYYYVNRERSRNGTRKNNNKGVIVLLVVIIVILALLCILFATGTIDLSNDTSNNSQQASESNQQTNNDMGTSSNSIQTKLVDNINCQNSTTTFNNITVNIEATESNGECSSKVLVNDNDISLYIPRIGWSAITSYEFFDNNVIFNYYDANKYTKLAIYNVDKNEVVLSFVSQKVD